MTRRAFAFVVLGLAAAALPIAARLGTDWLLHATESAVPSDVIVVLSGGSGERIGSALELYQHGMAPRILITDKEGFADSAFRWFEKHGVPYRALLAPQSAVSSTVEDALSVSEIVRRDGYASVLVVTSPYHCRRARAVFRHVLDPIGVRVTVVGSDSYYMDDDRWWRSAQGWRLVPMEFAKLLWWHLGGGLQ